MRRGWRSHPWRPGCIMAARARAMAAAQPGALYDVLLLGGTVYDAANGIDGELYDVAISGGKIAAVCRPGELQAESSTAAVERVDCTGLLVIPGLVDLHAHGFAGTGPVGIDFDTYCVSRGTTTVVDAGSPGASTFDGFRRYINIIIEASTTRVLAFLNISMIGLCMPGLIGCNQSMAYISADQCADCIEANRDVIVGVKTLLSKGNADEGRNEVAVYAAAQEAAARVAIGETVILLTSPFHHY